MRHAHESKLFLHVRADWGYSDGLDVGDSILVLKQEERTWHK